MAAHRAPVVALIGAVLIAIVVLLTGIWLGGHPSDLPSPLRGGFFQSRSGEPVTGQALSILTSRYYRPLDRSSLVDKGLAAMVASLDDPYSHYLDPSAYRASTERSNPYRTGIGINTMPEPGGLRVVAMFAGSPAARGGVMRADLITKVGSTSLADRPDDLGSELLRGPVGTQVTLTLLRGSVQHVVTLVRAKFLVPVAAGEMLSYDHVRIGYLRLRQFTQDSGPELRTKVQTALHAHAQALILDLRGNGGGLVDEAVRVASIFIPRGAIVSAVERGQARRVYSALGDAIAPRLPMVVLVDHGTASSSEIVTGALEDHGRARVVGAHTYGKGVFQQTVPLMNGGALAITVGRLFSPAGRYQGDGITPNTYAVDDPRTATDEALAVAERTVVTEVR